MDWQVEIDHDREQPPEVRRGWAQLRIVSRPAVWPHQVLLRLWTPVSRPLVGARLVRDGADGSLVEQQLTPTIRGDRASTFEYVLEPLDDAGAPRYVLDWEVTPLAAEHLGDSGEMLVIAASLVTVDADGNEECVDRSHVVLKLWGAPSGSSSDNQHALGYAASGWRLPAAAAAALREFIGADDEVTYRCYYCMLHWELDLLTVANRTWPVVMELGDDRTREALRRWSLSLDSRMSSNHCRCRRSPGTTTLSRLPPEVPEDVLRRDLAAARARHEALVEILRRR